MVLRARPVAIEVAETPPCHASMTRAVPPIEICGVAKVAADGTERFGATFFGQREFSLHQCSKIISKNGFRRSAVIAY
jgi:ribulose 1,5-bisphosphate synthetase/thiazole synthase